MSRKESLYGGTIYKYCLIKNIKHNTVLNTKSNYVEKIEKLLTSGHLIFKNSLTP